MAIYEEDNDGMPSLQHNAGDGTSASSVGTNSPDIFQVLKTSCYHECACNLCLCQDVPLTPM